MRILITLSFFCSLLNGCNSNSGPGNGKYAAVLEKHQPRITALRRSLTDIKPTLKDVGTSLAVVPNLSPVVNLGNYDTTGNTLMLQYHLLEAPENFTGTDSCFGLYYNTLAADAFKWTGLTKDRMIFEQDHLKTEEVEKKIASLSTDRFPYLLIVRTTTIEPLINNADGTFTGGTATASYYLYDWKNKKQLSAVSLTAKPDESMLYAYQGKDGAAGKFEAAKAKAQGTMQNNMRLQVYNWLKQITGGTAIVPVL